MNSKTRIALITAEILAIATLRAVMLLRRDRDILPRAAKTRRVSGRAVFSTPTFVGSIKKKVTSGLAKGTWSGGPGNLQNLPRTEARKWRAAPEVDIPIDDRYDSGPAE